MPQRSLHHVICLIVLSAYMLNLGLAAGGAVVCQDAHGQTRFEIASDHEHCHTDTVEVHDHDADVQGLCGCAGCPCDDSSLGFDVVATRKDEQTHTWSPDNLLQLEWNPAHQVVLKTPTRFVATAGPPRITQPARHLRTIILIV